jgi:phosphate/sulfate permease
MAEFFMVLGFALAAYAIVANDSIQTLGTFLASNAKRPWWILWIWISGIMVVTVSWGWFANGGDPAFGRLAAEGRNIPHPHDIGGVITWLFVLPPLCLVILTRMGIPVSTSLLVLTAFKGLVAAQQGSSGGAAVDLFKSMMEKSLVGYAIAFVVGLSLFFLVIYLLERKVQREDQDGTNNTLHPKWMVFQWLSTGFLWSMWLVQDLANIFVYLPRELTWWGLALALGSMVLMQGYIFREKGGKIQHVVTSKTNTLDVRSATFIDLLYGLVLLFFKVDYIPRLFEAMGMAVPWPEKMPMSTTWVFLGLLAGREVGIALRLRHRSKKKVSNLIFKDAGKAFFGSALAVLLALFLPMFIKPVAEARLEREAAAVRQSADLPATLEGNVVAGESVSDSMVSEP